MTARLLELAEIPAAVDTLAAAFANYPLLRLVAKPAWRPAAVAAFCRMLVNYAVRHGQPYTTPDRAAIACWLPPGREYLRFWGLVRAGGLSMAWRLGIRGTLRLERIEGQLDVARRKSVPGPHWYLNLLGVRPDQRGKGLSRLVVQPVYDIADRDRVPCYLETQDPVNVGIYRRLGFEVASETEPFPGLPSWGMVRRPM